MNNIKTKRAEIAAFNAKVIEECNGAKDYDKYVVAKYDRKLNLVGYFENRNQAISHHYRSKGLTDRSVVLKYLGRNRVLRNCMEKGHSWFDHYYAYELRTDQPITNAGCRAANYGTGFGVSKNVVLVGARGKEIRFASGVEVAEFLGIERSALTYYFATGRPIRNTGYTGYVEGKRKYFDTVKGAIKHFRLSKNNTKESMQQNNKIRGQFVFFKNEK